MMTVEFDHVCERSMERIVEASQDDQRMIPRQRTAR